MNNKEWEPEWQIQKTPSVNEGFKVGIVGGIGFSILNLLLFFMSGGNTGFDFPVWLLQVISYFFLGTLAARRQLEKQIHTYEALRGVKGAGVGAPLVTSLVVWLYIIVRGVVRDAIGIFIAVEPFSLCAVIFIDVFLALFLGQIAGERIDREYSHHDPSF